MATLKEKLEKEKLEFTKELLGWKTDKEKEKKNKKKKKKVI